MRQYHTHSDRAFRVSAKNVLFLLVLKRLALGNESKRPYRSRYQLQRLRVQKSCGFRSAASTITLQTTNGLTDVLGWILVELTK